MLGVALLKMEKPPRTPEGMVGRPVSVAQCAEEVALLVAVGGNEHHESNG
jgi:hypothetical protein